ncbi:MAG: DUF4290 domain-containing protein [Bacteroidetes bacterium]|nr:DUF4290 domain-containing protein [Bacteroidota bacterium]
MEYNTTREILPITEYGRNIKKMIDYTITVEDNEKRNKLAKAIVNVMSQLNLQMRDNNEFKHKLWDHLFILSDFKLDVDAPFPKPSIDSIESKPEKISYPSNNIAFKHYGKNIELIIQKAIEMEDGAPKDTLIKTIANHLKKSYLNWNRDSVTDEVIADHLEMLSFGKLKLGEEVRLNNTHDILANNKRRVNQSQNPSQNQNYNNNPVNRRVSSNNFQKNKPRSNYSNNGSGKSTFHDKNNDTGNKPLV